MFVTADRKWYIPQIIDTWSPVGPRSVRNKEVKPECMNLFPRAEILCPLSVLGRVRIIEVFLEEMYENFVGT